jgi:hypothetical protein
MIHEEWRKTPAKAKANGNGRKSWDETGEAATITLPRL